MSILIDTNINFFADKLNISVSRMKRDYGDASVDEIIEGEAARGNKRAVSYARECYYSPDKMIELFQLSDVENKYRILHEMDPKTRAQVLPLLKGEDLVMGLYFFTQEHLLKMLTKVSLKEVVNVIRQAFPLQQIVMNYSEKDLSGFFMNQELEKTDVIEQLKCMPYEIIQQFIEGVTGMPAEQTNYKDMVKDIENMPTDKYRKFMSTIDPNVQRQLVFQLTKTNPDYMELFEQDSYLKMLNKMTKAEMVAPMIALQKDSLVSMIESLPANLMSIVAAQVDEREFAKFLQKGHLNLLKDAWLM